mmetsp:Transcript_26350/g.76050  ORF Transcript_26350/g.76050 Transcript_26350/m.76050 type:complete len:259 (+) Transcript_26350:192-968(+)
MLAFTFVSTAAATTVVYSVAAASLIMSSSSSSTSSSSPLNIYLARHGQDEDNAAGILNGHRNQPLTSIGMRQASTVAEKIRSAGLTFDAIYSSPLQRAHQTALIIASEGQCLSSKCTSTHGSESAVQVMDQLIERDFGIMTGTPTKEIRSRCSGPGELLLTDTISYFLKPEGAESFPDLIERANGVIEDIRQQHEGKDESVLLVTHGDFGKMLYSAYYQLKWEDVLKQFHFGNSEVLILSKHSTSGKAHIFEIEQYNH